MGGEAVRQVNPKEAQAGAMRIADKPKLQLVKKVEVDRSRDALLTETREAIIRLHREIGGRGEGTAS